MRCVIPATHTEPVTVALMTVEELAAAVASGRAVKYLFFWGHRPQRDGLLGPECLSQWWPAAFTVDGKQFATAEHYMMWRKATLFGDGEIAGRILSAKHPHRAKELGRQVRGFDQHLWEQRRFDIVVDGSVAKFGQHEQLRELLLGTGERVLVEASPVDRIWGIGLAARDPRAVDPVAWRGQNLLGFALMRARQILDDGRGQRRGRRGHPVTGGHLAADRRWRAQVVGGVRPRYVRRGHRARW
jgi:ribA/ribD-fused uncharacterized protein